MMALCRPNEKAGRSARQLALDWRADFPALSNPPFRITLYRLSMPKPRRQNTITAIWETLSDADPKAVEKAFFMLFRQSPERQDSADTRQKLPELDKTY